MYAAARDKHAISGRRPVAVARLGCAHMSWLSSLLARFDPQSLTLVNCIIMIRERARRYDVRETTSND
jgi:hypothetical protein